MNNSSFSKFLPRLLPLAFLIAASGVAQLAFAQEAHKTSDGLEILHVRPNIYMIAGAGGNIGVQVGPDGVIVVNAGSADKTESVLSAIKSLSDQPIRYIIDTSADPDQVGGNEALSKAGRTLLPLTDTVGAELAVTMTEGGVAPILAQENVLLRMSAPTGKKSPFPADAWPSETFFGSHKYTHINGEAIEVLHQPAAHTDGDSFVFFRSSDVILAGNIIDTTHFPVIDLEKGGTIQGELDALNRLVDLTVPSVPFVWRAGGTYVIPGRGRICEQSDVVEYRDMVTIVRDIIQDMIKRGMTLDQVKEANPTKAYPQYGDTEAANAFVESVYESLTGKK
jgi:cyclase